MCAVSEDCMCAVSEDCMCAVWYCCALPRWISVTTPPQDKKESELCLGVGYEGVSEYNMVDRNEPISVSLPRMGVCVPCLMASLLPLEEVPVATAAEHLL